MFGKKITIIGVLLFVIFFSLTFVSASQDNSTLDGLIEDNADMMSSCAEDVNESSNNLKHVDENIVENGEGEFVDVSEAYDYLNAFRTENGTWQLNSDDVTKTYFNTDNSTWLLPLQRDIELEETAKTRAKEIAQVFSHTRPDGTDCFSAFPEGLVSCGENIAYGYATCADVTEAWKETNDDYAGQGHRRNMLNGMFNCVGIAGYKMNGMIYWVQDFGTRYNPTNLSSEVFTITNNTPNPTFKIKIPKYATERIIVYIDGNPMEGKYLTSGEASITVYGLTPKSYVAEVLYVGDYNYNRISKKIIINVTQSQTPVSNPTFSYLNTLIQMTPKYGEIKLEKDYVYDETIDSNLKGCIFISKPITIDGQGHTIDAKNQARIFGIEANDDVTFKNIKFVNGIWVGGAIYAYTNISVINSTFINNSANGDGGAIYSSNGVKVVNSSFINNTAQSNGGAIYSSSSISVINSNFTNNKASELGGAIYTKTNLNSTNSIFTNNRNLHVYAGLDFADINNKFFNDKYFDIFINASKNNVVINLNEDLIATQTIIISGNNVVIDGNGYGINAQNKHRIFFITGKNVTIRNIVLINGNSSNGGAIYSESPILISNSYFANNSAQMGGGVYSQSANITLINSYFVNNFAQMGGGVYSAFGDIKITGSAFANNLAINGGSVCSSASAIVVRDSNFIANIAQRGGALYSFNGLISISNSNFTNNIVEDFEKTGKTEGGSIYNHKGDVFIEGSKFNNNSANYGGVIHTGGNIINFINSTFENNHALLQGGGVAHTTANVNITNSIFKNNAAPAYGGAIFNYGEDLGKVFVKNSIFTNNTSDAGAAIVSLIKVDVSDSIFANNSATGYGGVISNWGEISISNSTFLNNTAPTGGVICNYGKNVSMTTSNFISNSASNAGGIIYNLGGLIITNSNFTNNNAPLGGVISNDGNVYVLNSIFINNSGEKGGVIRNVGDKVSIRDSTFLNNSAKTGGAIYNHHEGNVSIIHSSFKNNNAEYGGAIYSENDMYWYIGYEVGYDNGYVHVSNSNFINNNASYGGAIYNLNNTFSIFNSSFIDNNASYGGAICDYQGSGAAQNSTFINEKVTCDILNAKMKLINSKFFENNIDVTDKYMNTSNTNTDNNNNTTNINSTNAVTTAFAAKNKSFKAKIKTKKYTITLKAGKNPVKKVKVYIKIKGKTYTATTNNKGKATFKIKKLSKKGKYKATLSFKGNAYYKKVSKKINIKIK